MDMAVAQAGEGAAFEEFKRKNKGVKHLVDSGIQELPKFFVREAAAAAAAAAAQQAEIPVIDLATSDHAQIVKQLNEACEEWGFFQVVNHGLPPVLMHKMLQAVEDFFDLPFEAKQELFTDDISQALRFGTSHNPSKESVLEWKDYLRHPCLPLDTAFENWPSVLDKYKSVAKPYVEEVVQLADRLFHLVSEALGLNPRFLTESLNCKQRCTLTSNYYPPCPQPEATIGIAEHSDIGALTLLLTNGVEGLEVFHDGEWVCVHPVEDAFIVNLGDYTQITSNGRYKSVLHRGKVNNSKLRISVAAFFQPSFDAYTRPLPELLSETTPALYRSTTFGEFFNAFFAAKLRGKRLVESMKI